MVNIPVGGQTPSFRTHTLRTLTIYRNPLLTFHYITGMLDGILDEPGVYREGMHGIRHENLVLVRPVGDNEFGSFLGFETLTLCHFDTSSLEVSLLTADEREWLNAYNQRVYNTLSSRLPAEVSAWLFAKTRPV